jgi:hypothetical protein
MVAKPRKDHPLLTLANIGPAMCADLEMLDIHSVAELALQDADTLYRRLNVLSNKRHDPCVWDVFSAAIHQAKTGEAKPWWLWTPERKRRHATGEFRI